MNEEDVLRRLDAIESRLAQIEQKIGARRTSPPPLPSVDAGLIEASEYIAPRPIAKRKVRPPSRGLEQAIGLQWAGWIGAVVLVIGAGFGIKFGYDQGWFSIATPAIRLGLLAMAGFGLIAAGEWVYRRVNVLSAVALFGAGVAMLFLISYAGQTYYHLYSRAAAFVFMAMASLIGIAVARRGRLVSIAVLAMIGGNLAPALVGQDQPELAGFFAYLLLLQLASLALAAWGANPKWWALRGLSLVTTGLWVAAVMDNPPWYTTQVFAIIFAVLYQAELLFSVRRQHLGIATAGATFSVLVTAALTAVTLYLQRDASQTARLLEVLALGGMTAGLAMYCRRTGARGLAIGYSIQSLGLLLVAVPVAFSGVWIAFAWGVLGIVFAAVGRVLNLRSARSAGAISWLLATADLLLWTLIDTPPHWHQIAFTFAETMVPTYAMMSGVLAAMGHLTASLAEPVESPASPSWAGRHSPLRILSGLLWVFAALAAFPSQEATGAILLYAALMLLAEWRSGEPDFSAHAMATGIFAAIKWTVSNTLDRLDDPLTAAPAILNSRGICGAGVLAILVLLHLRSRQKILRQATVGLGVGVLLWIGSFAIDQAFINQRLAGSAAFSDPVHAEQVALSIYWSVFALASVLAGFARRLAGLRYFGLGLFAIMLLKVVTIDMNQVSTGYRILSFIGLGGLLIGTSVVYGKVSPRLLANSSADQQ